MNIEIPAGQIFSKWYLPETTYVNAIQAVLAEDGKIIGGTGRYTANPAIHMAFREPSYIDAVRHLDDVTTQTRLTVTPAHMEGHPWAYPGHKSSRAMEHCIYANLSRDPVLTALRLTAYESVAYRQRINCGDTLEVISTIEPINDSSLLKAEAKISVNGNVAAIMRGIRLTTTLQKLDQDTILFDQLQEGAAQTAGILAIEGLSLEGFVPLYGATGAANFDKLPKAGDIILFQISKLIKNSSMFRADVRICIATSCGEEEIGNISKILGFIVPKEKIT